jgi:hypothetical protein
MPETRARATARPAHGGIFRVRMPGVTPRTAASLVREPVSARSGRTFSLLFQSNSLREILARLLAAVWMAMAEDERASGVALA